jgi:hypothetical protein
MTMTMMQADSRVATDPVSGNAGSRVSLLRRRLVVIAVCSLTVSLVTRFSLVAALDNHPQTAIKSQPPTPKRQHLANDGLQWIAPPAKFQFFTLQPATMVVLLPAVPPVITLYAESCLHDRPPPSC